MKLVSSPRFRKSLRHLDPQTQERVRQKLKLFLRNKAHPSLRYKTVQALKNENPPV
jgi:mRNA-degrading endonuclease RelE of RelBE toxin-antitoxin system